MSDAKTLTAEEIGLEKLAYWDRSPGRRFTRDEWRALIDLARRGLALEAEVARLRTALQNQQALFNVAVKQLGEVEEERDRYQKVAELAREHRQGQCDWLTDPDLDAALAAVGMKVEE